MSVLISAAADIGEIQGPAVSRLPIPGVSPGPVVSSPNWSDYRNYPNAARRRDQEGMVGFVLRIDASGIASDCYITSPSGSESLDAGTCVLARRMKFTPARDDKGRAIPSSYRNNVYWLLADPRPLEASSLDVTLRYDNGNLADCKVSGTGPYLEVWRAFVCKDATIYPEKLARENVVLNEAVLSLRLNTESSAHISPPWPSGKILARDATQFLVNRAGDAASCSAETDGDIFSNDFRSHNPCGHFISAIWFKSPKQKNPPVFTRFELRLIETQTEKTIEPPPAYEN